MSDRVTSTQLAVSFDGRDLVDVVLAKTQSAVAGGVHSIWLACHLFQRDPVATAGVLLSRYSNVTITLVALSPYAMHPVHIAMAAATLNEFFPGRVTLCLGVGAPADLAGAGIKAHAPLATMGEALTICRDLLAGETVHFEGTKFKIASRALASPAPVVPILLAASGPQMLRLAGRAADGVVLSAGTSVEFLRWSLEQVEADGVTERFERHAFIYASVADDATIAADRVRRLLAIVLRGAHHKANLDRAGSTLDQAAVGAAVAAGDMAQAERLVTNEIVARHAAAGTPEAFRARLSDYRSAGIDNLVLASMRTPREVETVITAAKD